MDPQTAQHPVYRSIRLFPDQEEIRLLHLLPGGWLDPIKCQLTIGRLSDRPVYYGLSYVWGDSIDRPIISINNEPFPVTKNLFSALRRIRAHYPAETTVLWVDAICIDQSNTTERSNQVAMMGKIYSCCREVLMWLGELDPKYKRNTLVEKLAKLKLPGLTRNPKCYRFTGEDSDFDEKWDRYLGDFKMKRQSGSGQISFADAHLPNTESIEILLHIAWAFRLLMANYHFTQLPPYHTDKFKQAKYATDLHAATLFIRSNKYFKRLWTVQETVLAPSASALFGPIRASTVIFAHAVRNLRAHQTRPCCDITLGRVYDRREFFRSAGHKFAALGMLKGLVKSQNMGIFDICIRYQKRISSEDIDRVYALLSLVADWGGRQPIQPDYRIAVAEVYIAVCKDTFVHKKSRMPLICCTQKPSLTGIPSWVTDWSSMRSQKVQECWIAQIENYKAGGPVVGAFVLTDDNILKIPALKFDDIVLVGDVMCYSDATETKELFEDWQKLAGLELEPDRPYPGGSTWRDAWWRTICGDRCRDGALSKRLTDEDVLACSDYFTKKGHPTALKTSVSETGDKRQEQDKDAAKRTWRVDEIAEYTTDNRRLFVTNNGYLGLGREDVQMEDEIFLFPGARTPCVLRRTGNQFTHHRGDVSKPMEQGYMSLSGCFVQGIMYGEAATKEAMSKYEWVCIE
jgi:hypothetical protein